MTRIVQKISVYLSFSLDDSYTPSTLAIRAGTGPSDLQDVRMATLDKPEGWITFDVSSELIGDEEEGLCVTQVSFSVDQPALHAVSSHSKPVYAYILQIIVVANHMSGKDTHVRGLRVLGPVECVPFKNRRSDR
jgi:anaphase-promoting complex subunit 10